MYEKVLNNLGLTKTQANILSYLLENGEKKAKDIVINTKIPRGVVYKGLEELEKMNLIEKILKENEITRFRAEHPSKIEEIFEKNKNEIKRRIESFHEVLPYLTSTYNLAFNKPGVRFYEGPEGIKRVLFDSLRSKTEIYTYVDVEAVERNLKDINDEYTEKREKLKIRKKIIIPDTPKNREYFKNLDKEITLVKFIKQNYYPFETGMQIYDNKISYQTVTEENKVAVLIEDKHIYLMHKLFFEYIWNSLPEN
jgi:HTH-type transcriptional regulator, sugar sensing transcriptional regulator